MRQRSVYMMVLSFGLFYSGLGQTLTVQNVDSNAEASNEIGRYQLLRIRFRDVIGVSF